MTVTCYHRGGAEVPVADHGRLEVGMDVPTEGLWCPAWPQHPRRRNFLKIALRKFRVLRPAGQRAPRLSTAEWMA